MALRRAVSTISFPEPSLPCPANRDSFPAPLDKGSEGSGNEIAVNMARNLGPACAIRVDTKS